MTLKQLEQRISDLERQVAELQRERKSMPILQDVGATFRMMGEDSDFNELVRLGQDYRRQVNDEYK